RAPRPGPPGHTRCPPIPRPRVARGRGRRSYPTPTRLRRRCASRLTAPVFLDEGGRCTEHAGGARELPGNDPAGLHGILERAPVHLAPKGLEEAVTGEGYPAADHDHVRVEDVDDVGDAGAQEFGGVVHDVERVLVAVVRRLVYGLRRQPGQIAVHVLAERRVDAGFDPFGGPGGDRGARRVGLEAAVVPALAATAVRVDGRVADLTRHIGHAVIDLAVEHDPAADAGPDRESHHRLRAPRGSPPPLAVDGAIGVVVQLRGQTGDLGDPVPEREVRPTEVGGEQDDAAVGVEGTGRTDADAHDLLAFGGGRRLLDQAADASDDGVGAFFGVRRLRHFTEQLRPVLGNRPDDQVGPADINPDDVAHQSPRLRRSPVRRGDPACNDDGPADTRPVRAWSR